MAFVRKIARVGLISLSCTLFLNFVHGQAVQLANIEWREVIGPNEYSELTRGNDKLFFIVWNTELWTSNGLNSNTSEDTKLLRRFKSVSDLTLVGSTLYFIADDGVSGGELWKSNGSPDGTVKVKDIRSGAQGSNIRSLTNVYGTLYFSANDGKHGQELWRSNGGPKNTTMLKDIIPNKGSSNPTSLTSIDRTLYFSANDGVHGYELWKSSGTTAGTVLVKDIRSEPGLSSLPDQLVNVNGSLYFAALSSGKGRELWRSDGTAAGTWLVKDIRPGSIGSEIQNTTAVNRTLFFTATDGIHGHELWKSDGTAAGTVLVKDMTPGPEGSHGESPSIPMGSFANMYGTLFYTAFLGQTSYIWKSDGTQDGTIPIVESWGKDATSQPLPQFTWLDNKVWFIVRPILDAGDGQAGYLVSSYDKDVYMGSILELLIDGLRHPPYHPEMVRLDDYLYISGRPNYWEGFKIVAIDVFANVFPTLTDADDSNIGSNPHEFVEYNNLVYFFAKTPDEEKDELMVTDGTPEGTTGVDYWYYSYITETEVIGNHLYSSVASSSTSGASIRKTNLNSPTRSDQLYYHDWRTAGLLTNVTDSLYFVAGVGSLWKSNGTETGTRFLKDFHHIRAMDALNGTLMFRALHEDGTEELWRSDENDPAPVKIKTLHTGVAREAASYPTASIGDTYYFVANDGIHGNELWTSKGTSSTTNMVIDLNTSDAGTGPENDIRTFVTFRDTLYFSALGNDGVWSLYKTNGTAGGTRKITNLGPLAHAVAEGDQLHLFVNKSADDRSTVLWKTDGTAGGTTRILDLNGTSGQFYHKILNGWLYFSINEHGPLWRTDGTTCGTMQVNTGVQGAYPIAAINSTLIFGGYTVEDGREPYALNTTQIPDAPCDDTISPSGASSILVTTREGMSSYPNPFSSEFAFRIDGNDDEFARIKVTTLAGHPIEEIKELRLNTDHTIGKLWAPGVYLIRVQMKDKVKTQMVVKR